MDQTILQPWREYKSLFGVGGLKRPSEQCYDNEPSPQRQRTDPGPSLSPEQSPVICPDSSDISMAIDLDQYIVVSSDDDSDNGTDYSLP
jgi:hypothetical protein